MPAGARLTGRLRRHVAAGVAAGAAVSTACHGLMSWPIGHAWASRADAQLAEPEPVRVLGIEETRRGRARLGPGSRPRPVAADRAVRDQLRRPRRLPGAAGTDAVPTSAAVVDWLNERGQVWKDAVQIVAMHPCASYRSAASGAASRADRRRPLPPGPPSQQAVTDVCRRVSWDTHGRRGRNNDPAWAARRRLLRGRERLSHNQFVRIWNDLTDGDPSGQILTARIAEEELRALLALAHTGGQRHQVTNLLFRFHTWCADSKLPELERLTATIDAWWPEVLAFQRTGVTNAGPRPPTGP